MAIDLTELEFALNTVTLPGSGDTNKLEPDSTLKQSGWDFEQLPKHEHFNWLFFKLYKAIEDLDGRTVIAGQLPVGSIYMNEDSDVNPATLLGYGTWEAVNGQAMIGAGDYTDDNGETRTLTAGDTGGSFQETLTISQIPNHGHNLGGKSLLRSNKDEGSSFGPDYDPTDNDGRAVTATNEGGGQAHNNMMPYRVVNMWKRTA